ncbi:MAG: FtsX-like permease family protein [Aureliella sp.]
MRTPLAWKNLTSSYSKCVLAATGVGFAVVLMFTQIGFRNALIDNNVQLFTLFDGDVANLAIVSKARYNVSTEQRFPRRTLELAAAVDGVLDTCSVSIERGTASIKVSGFAARPIRVLGIELSSPDFLHSPSLFEQLQTTVRTQSALVDRRSKTDYGFARTSATLREQSAELNGKAISFAGQFNLGTDFGNDGTLLMAESVHAAYFPWRNKTGDPRDVVDIGFLRVDPSYDLEEVSRQIESLAPQQIDVQPTTQLIAREKSFWAKATPIGKIFFIGTIMGLVVGAIICYQIQFTDITEHMPEFATLKAMGYGPRYFWGLILCQSLYLAFLGFVPGLIVSFGLYQLLAEISGLVMSMTLSRIALVWVLTLVMCVVSGSLAIRKLFNSDPASLF